MEISIKVFGNVVKCFFYVIGQSDSTLYIYIYYILYILYIYILFSVAIKSGCIEREYVHSNVRL